MFLHSLNIETINALYNNDHRGNFMEYHLVVADIDGTLVDDNRRFTDFTKKAIDALREKGIWFGLASGRPVDELRRLEKTWGFEKPFEIQVGMNGAELWDGLYQQEYKAFQLSPKTIKEIFDYMKPFPDARPSMYLNGEIMTDRYTDIIERSGKRAHKGIHLVKSYDEFWAQPNAKAMFRVSEELMKKVEAYIEANPRDDFKGFKTQSTMMEFADPHTSKAYSLTKFAQIHHMDMASIMTFGDMTNDIDMLKAAGFGVCMANGSDDTKAVAKDITRYTNNEDGFAHYIIEHFHLTVK